ARRGGRRRLMLIGSLALPVFFALTFAAPRSLGPAIGAVWVLVAFLLTATAFSLFQVPYIALPAELTDSYDERTTLLTWREVVLTVAILLFGAGGPLLRGLTGDPTTGYLLMGVVAGVVIGLGLLVATGSAAHARARRPAMSAAGVAVATDAEIVADEVDGARDGVLDAPPSAYRTGIAENFRAAFDALRRSQPFRVL